MADGPEGEAIRVGGTTSSRMSAALHAVWSRARPVVRARLAVIDQAAAAAAGGSLAATIRQEAIAEAHKLAGSLGMFGFSEASGIAARIESTLHHDPIDSAAVERMAVQLHAQLDAELAED